MKDTSFSSPPSRAPVKQLQLVNTCEQDAGPNSFRDVMLALPVALLDSGVSVI